MKGDVEALAGIYSVSFLGVMATFTVGCCIVTVARRRAVTGGGTGLLSILSSTSSLPMAMASPASVLPYWHLLLALLLVLLALGGNLFGKGMDLALSFLAYFIPLYLICLVCLCTTTTTTTNNNNNNNNNNNHHHRTATSIPSSLLVPQNVENMIIT